MLLVKSEGANDTTAAAPLGAKGCGVVGVATDSFVVFPVEGAPEDSGRAVKL
jgi:hypothetical protein